MVCKNGGKCIDGLNTYYCSCHPGFHGRHCSAKGDAGLKGQKGDMGAAGMSGAKGEPGESISAPVVVVSPKTLTVNEGGSASFQCSGSGNPNPVTLWSKTRDMSKFTRSSKNCEKLEKSQFLPKLLNSSRKGNRRVPSKNCDFKPEVALGQNES